MGPALELFPPDPVEGMNRLTTSRKALSISRSSSKTVSGSKQTHAFSTFFEWRYVLAPQS